MITIVLMQSLHHKNVNEKIKDFYKMFVLSRNEIKVIAFMPVPLGRQNLKEFQPVQGLVFCHVHFRTVQYFPAWPA